MNVIWKRPDGFHGALPADFVVFELGGNYNIWLHRVDNERFPLRVSGGWEEEKNTSRLNILVNLLVKDASEWVKYLQTTFNHSMDEEPDKFIDDLYGWLNGLRPYIKGDHWEITILNQLFDAIAKKLDESRNDFLKSVSLS